ncbi:hypothetical protein D7W81_18145 [Corallococcus aberystwythensis]|uniref:DUF6310 domain-containing protein n=1 Tax=Corallococcus aberystwythensis TaxID=2316722 RepID=A0A3A8Q7F7_9BACT|nr:hypothetical protein D7W81_18145 [Corallococcus aberystwythensis]
MKATTRLRACLALLFFLSACATSAPDARMFREQRVTNLQRAAQLPWKDEGRCVVQEAAQPWSVLAKRCFPVLDHDRVRFHDTTGRCTVASTDAAVLVWGVCVLAAPEIIAGAVIVIGVVVVAVAIKEAMDAHELRHLYPEEAGTAHGTQITTREHLANQQPTLEPEPAGKARQPPAPPWLVDQTRRARCEPIPVKHRGGDDAHNKCADRIPPNRYPGMDVLVDGKHFDALQVGVHVLWEIKTDQFATYSLFLRNQVITAQVEELLEERRIARACGYGFVIGVSSDAHKAALLEREPSLAPDVVVTGCTR